MTKESESREVRAKDVLTRESVPSAASGEKVRNRHCAWSGGLGK